MRAEGLSLLRPLLPGVLWPGAPHRPAWALALGPGRAARPGCLRKCLQTRNPARGAARAQWPGSPGRAEVAVSGRTPSRVTSARLCPGLAPCSPQTPPPRRPWDLWGFRRKRQGGPGASLSPEGPDARVLHSQPRPGGQVGGHRHPFLSQFRVPLSARTRPWASTFGHMVTPGGQGQDLQGGCWGPCSAEGGGPGQSGLDRACGSTAPQLTGGTRAGRTGQSL